MSGHCIEKINCPKCGGDNLQIFEKDGVYTGFCFSGRCKTYFSDPYNGGQPNPKEARREPTEEEVQEELNEIDTYHSRALPDRRLTQATLEHFGIKVGVSEEDGQTPQIKFFPFRRGSERTAYKVKTIDPKSIWITGDFQDVDMFGWYEAIASGGYKLFITEGEEDAAALYQALKNKAKGTKWEGDNPAVVSLTSGASSARRDLARVANVIRSTFREVILAFDMDEAGEKARQDALQVLPTARAAILPSKDANACLIEGREKALVASVLFNAETPKNTRVVNALSLYQAAREQVPMGLSWPWEGLTKMTRGIRFGETIYLGAGVKMGKSEAVDQIASHLMIEHNLPIFMAKPEQSNKQTIQKVLGKVSGKIYYDPEVPFDYLSYDKAAELVGNKLNLLNLYQHMGWNSLRDDIVAASEAGCKAIFIDPITNLVNGISAGETDTQLKEIAQELAALAMDLQVVIFIFCHLKAPLSGDPHERGGKVMSSQFAGSRGMMRSCNLMLGLEGNKDPDLTEEERNMRRLVVLEDREFGSSGSINLFWDKNTTLFKEV